ncbi:MAG: hypothetical protein AB7I32_14400, partial [Gammaproteobacteria bacterium]
LASLLEDAGAAGLHRVTMEMLAGNRAMRRLASRYGFDLKPHPDDTDLIVGQRSLGRHLGG